ncbi:hypothetical protein MNBD_GAMMA11-2190, partial [hydrothermal vent metagenome]
MVQVVPPGFQIEVKNVSIQVYVSIFLTKSWGSDVVIYVSVNNGSGCSTRVPDRGEKCEH